MLNIKPRFWGLIITLVVIVVGVLIYWMVYTSGEPYQAQKFFDDLERQYLEDTVGGNTAEETLAMFIDALRVGDVELASRYFSLEQQEEQLEDLTRVKEKGLLGAMVRDLGDLELSKNDEEEAFYVLTDDTNLVVVQVIIVKNSRNGIWKIIEL